MVALIGAIYRSELARGLGRLGYRVEKTHADGRFEIAGVPRPVVEAFSTRRAEIEAGMAERGMGTPSDNPRLAERAALVSGGEAVLEGGTDMASSGRDRGTDSVPESAARAVDWAVAHLSERERTGLMAPSHALREGINEIVRERLARDGIVHGPARERLQALTGERIAALEAVGDARAKGRGVGLEEGRSTNRDSGGSPSQERERTTGPETEPAHAPKSVDRDLGM